MMMLMLDLDTENSSMTFSDTNTKTSKWTKDEMNGDRMKIRGRILRMGIENMEFCPVGVELCETIILRLAPASR